MSPLQLVQLLAALASAVAAGLLWASRGRRGPQGASEALERMLQAKDAEIAALAREALALRELTPIKIREYLLESHTQIRRYGAVLDEAYRAAQKAVEACNAEITRSQEQGEWRTEGISQLVERREALLQASRAMQPGLRELLHQCDFPETISLRVARVPPDSIQGLTQAYLDLARVLPLAPAGELPALSARVAQNLKYRLDSNTLFSDALFVRPAGPGEIWQRPDNGE
jgi:hypothetical protein